MSPDEDNEQLTTVPVDTPTVTATRGLSHSETRPPHALRPGDRVCDGRFEILRQLGHGGMGVVHAAFDHSLGEQVAFKTLTQADAADIYRLKNEFRALADVVHPNLVTLHELFHDQGRWAFSMELIAGVPFIEWVRPGGGLDEGRLRAVLPQLLSAIDTIHQAGQLHRDLKPSNVLVTESGHVMVLDLGLAVPREPGGVGRTLEHEGIIGTPAYMAPEQVTEAVATTASDYYALGVMLFEALTDVLPFSGSVGSVLMAKQVRDAPKVRTLNPDAAPDLAGITDALLARAPDARPDAKELGAMFGSPSPSAPLASGLPPAPHPLLVGRADELARLRSGFQRSLSGTLTVTFMSGPSGVGKTALLETATRQLEASHGVIVLAGRCYEREAVPYKAFDTLVDDLSRYLRRLSAPDASVLLPRDIRTLAHMFPVLDRVPVVAEAPERIFDSAQEQRERAFAAFGELLGRIRDRRALIVHIDDMQWCDAESTLFLCNLIEHGHLPPLQLVLSFRSEATEANDGALATIRKALEAAGHTAFAGPPIALEKLAVAPLGLADCETLALSLLSQAPEGPTEGGEQVRMALAERIAREAEGSPLFVGELARYVNTHQGEDAISLGTLTLSLALRSRLAQLPEPAQRLLEAVSVSARPLPFAIARRAAHLGEGDGAARDQLRAALFVRVTQATGEPALLAYHDRVRETVHDGLSPERLKAVHNRLADALLAEPDADPEALAHHLDLAGRQEEAAAAALSAARRAMGVLAFERAAGLLRKARALGHFEDARSREIAIALATALSSAGRGPEAAEAYLEAGAMMPERVVELRLSAARQLSTTGYLGRGLGLVEELLAEHGLRPTEDRQSAAAPFDRLWLRLRGYDVRPKPVSDIPANALLHMELSALCQSGFILVDQTRAVEFATRTLKLAIEYGHAPRCVRMIAVLASLEANSGHTKRAARLIDRAEHMLTKKVVDTGLYEPEEIEATRIEVEQEAGITAMFRGEFETSVGRLETALAMHRRWTNRRQFMVSACESFRSWSLFHLGRFEELRAHILPQIKLAEQRGDLLSAALLAGATGVAAFLTTDDAAEARTRLEWSEQRWPGERFDLQRAFLLLGLTWVDFYEQRYDQAWSRLQGAWQGFSASPVVRVSHTMRTYGGLTHGLAAAAMIEHVPSDQRDGLRRIVQHSANSLERLSAFPPARGHAHVLKAAAARTRHDPGTAQRELRAALQCYREGGYVLYAAAAEQRLGELLGGRPGSDLLKQSYRSATRAGIARPERIVDMLLPIR